TRSKRDWSSDVCSSDLSRGPGGPPARVSGDPGLAWGDIIALDEPATSDASRFVRRDAMRRGGIRSRGFQQSAVAEHRTAARGQRSEERRVGKGWGARGD